mmetsp:Transcript_9032/g.21735  ORF Transcript_9032/g.21735 Transcript_9032/m.21735 type:complete len:520 (-) Transcript_9032:187-1746(-)|eukprot:CAMPEP_0177589834 /NCGR_PEP_ID=MMETSP0419_2-20121207/7044_1 /TAXON_ID=582737 /ORGANISM="Tetraselmis sp., Strain GSL018" /LENGTH=519 /DNA_ID=CAMNT_0019080273 /DNA_START=394 /DNA_END=1953 /DNA_ORIENTATION=+
MLVLKSSVDECPPKTSPLLPNASVHVGQPQQQSQPDELDDLEDILSQPQPSARARLSESWASDPEVVLLADRPWEEVQKTAFALEEFKRRAAELGKLFLNPMSYTVAASASLGVAAGALVGGPCGALYGGVLGVKGGAAAAVAGAALHNASRELLHGLGGAPRPGTPPARSGEAADAPGAGGETREPLAEKGRQDAWWHWHRGGPAGESPGAQASAEGPRAGGDEQALGADQGWFGALAGMLRGGSGNDRPVRVSLEVSEGPGKVATVRVVVRIAGGGPSAGGAAAQRPKGGLGWLPWPPHPEGSAGKRGKDDTGPSEATARPCSGPPNPLSSWIPWLASGPVRPDPSGGSAPPCEDASAGGDRGRSREPSKSAPSARPRRASDGGSRLSLEIPAAGFDPWGLRVYSSTAAPGDPEGSPDKGGPRCSVLKVIDLPLPFGSSICISSIRRGAPGGQEAPAQGSATVPPPPHGGGDPSGSSRPAPTPGPQAEAPGAALSAGGLRPIGPHAAVRLLRRATTM